MAEKVRYVPQTRVASTATGVQKGFEDGPWMDCFKDFDDIYAAIAFRDNFDQWIRAVDNPIARSLLMLMKEIGGNMEIRIIKRAISEEIVEEAEKVTFNG